MSANKPQQGGQKPNKEDEFNQGGQQKGGQQQGGQQQGGQQQGGQQQGGQQKGRDTQDTPNDQRGKGGQGGGR